MKQFSKVLGFSYLSQMKSKGFIISTIIMVLIIGIGMSVPSIINLFKNDETEEIHDSQQTDEPGDEDLSIIVVVDPQGLFFPDTNELEAMFPDFGWSLGDYTQDELTAQVENEDIAAAIIVQDDMNAIYIRKLEMNVFGTNISSGISQHMADLHRYRLLMTYNVDETDAEKFFVTPLLDEVYVGMTNMIGQVQGMVFIVFLYITIVSCGQLVTMSVIQEKSSRAMEILITTTKPEILMFGKVIGIGLAGITQMVLYILVGVAFYLINQNAMMSVDMLSDFFNVPLSTFAYVFIFYIGGFFFYAMMFGALGSLISRMEDMGSAQGPMMLFTMVGFFIALYGQLYGFADSVFYKVCSYVPFTSPYVMLARATGETNIAFFEVLLSIVILYASTAFVGLLSAKIYRIGVLMYGKPPSIKEVFAALKQS